VTVLYGNISVAQGMGGLFLLQNCVIIVTKLLHFPFSTRFLPFGVLYICNKLFGKSDHFLLLSVVGFSVHFPNKERNIKAILINIWVLQVK